MLRVYLIALIGSLVVSLVMTPVSIYLAECFGAMDPVDSRKIHNAAMPRWGGIGILSGFFASLLILWFAAPEFRKLLKFSKEILRDGKVYFTLNLGEQLAGILFGVLLLFILGLVDDRKPVRAGMKFLFQIIAAFVAMIYGVRIYGLSVPGLEAYSHFPVFLTMVLTVLWLVGMANAINLVDGLDGLAAGIVSIVSFSFLAVSLVQPMVHSALFNQQMKLAAIIAAALLGGNLGFLVFNFYPARVFMGDGGSISLGFLVGCIAVIGTFKTTILAVLIVPLLLAALPMADMTFVFGRRLFQKRNPFEADRGHFHHRLLDAGWTQKEIVLLVYVVTLIFSVISVTVVGMKK